MLRRLRELDHVLGVRLRVVVRDEDGGVFDVVDRAVVEDVAGRVAHVGRERVLDALGPLADDGAHQENGLHALGVGRAVEREGGVGRVAREVDALAVQRRVLAAEAPVEPVRKSNVRVSKRGCQNTK